MRKLFSLLTLSLIGLMPLSAQIFDPVSWSFSYEEIEEGKYDLVFTATIEEGSHLYGMEIPEGGPIPTSFTFEPADKYSLEGKVRSMSEGKEVFDRAFEMDILYYSGEAEFRQTIVLPEAQGLVKGYVTFMACDDERCSPPQDIDFNIQISQGETLSESKESPEVATQDNVPGEGSGMWKFFILSMLAGLAGVLTPCVFPMIPMTVAFFSQGSENRTKAFTKAIIFGLSIIILYSSLGIIVSLTSAGANFANTLSTHWIPNLLFFILFIIFAASFLGAFELVLPNKWVSGADSKVDKGGLIAAFFLGVTTVLVSFSCTGPIVGVLLVEAASGDVLRPTIGMFGFGLAFALPFTVFALFPSVMNKLPKSGGWLNAIKVVLGIIMLAFSLKFLSSIDSVYGLGILNRDIYLVIWIVLFVLLGLYLMGKIKFSHDSELKHIGVFRFMLIVASFSFALYLVPGLFGAPLTGISSLLPAKETLSFDLTRQQTVTAISAGTENDSNIRYADKFHLPYNLTGYFEYEQGVEAAREQGKPVFLDFKGHACSNCKEMESKVWSDPGVLQRLRDNFVIIALYCDDRTKLPEDEWYTSDIDGKLKNTIGKINTDREIRMFGTNTQPLYVITDYQGNALSGKMGHNLNVNEYIEWLDEGLAAFEGRN